jgi:hypothetical protein
LPICQGQLEYAAIYLERPTSSKTCWLVTKSYLTTLRICALDETIYIFQQKVAEESDEDLGEAIVLLWAMERVFIDAWSHAKSLLSDHPLTGNESSHIKTIRELVENWSREEFEQFVDECAKQVNNQSMSV